MHKKYQLKNGLNVLQVESHKSPVVSVQMWVKTGSADETKGEEGISHFIEHLVFKGTRKFEVGEIASTIEGSGGQLNAYTSFDETVFYVTMSKNFLEVGLEAIAEMMGFPRFDSDEIDNEREVVIEEIKRGLDNPHRQASRQLFSTVYKKHPYRLPVIGYADNIKEVSRETLVNYYQSRYVPKNMTLLVVGDFENKELKPLVEKWFGDFEPYQLNKVKRNKEPKQEKSRIQVQSTSFQECLFYIAWPVPSAQHKDIPALDVMSLILGQGSSSRLTRSLKIEKGLVNYIGASSFTPKDKGFAAVSMSMNPDKLPEVLDALLDEMEDFLTTLPSEKELEKAVVNFNSDELYTMETVDGMANKLGMYQNLFDDPKYYKTFIKQVNEVSAKDVRKIAKKYLKPDAMSLVLMTPGDEAEGKKLLQKFKRSYNKMFEGAKLQKQETEKFKKRKVKWTGLSAKKYESHQDKIETLDLPGGGKAFLRPNLSTQVLSVRMGLLGGLRAEERAHGGVTELLSRTWGRATAQRDEHSISDFIDFNAASLSAFGGRNTAGLSMTCLHPFAKDMSDLMAEVVLQPEFADSTVEREKNQMREYLRMREDNPAQLAIKEFNQNLFRGHPYSVDMHGTEESIDGLSPEALRAHLATSLKQGNAQFAVTGHFDIDEWKERLHNLSSEIAEGEKFESKFQVEPLMDDIKKFQEIQKEQSHIVYGFPGLTFTSKERFTLQIIQSILAGQGGRLFLELRDKASLAYTVAPLRMEGIDAGYFGAYIGCSPEKGEQAISMMKIEFEKLMNEAVSKDELDRSKRYLIGRHDIDLQKTSSVSAAILFDSIYGLPADEAFQFPDKINAVTPQGVQDLAQKIFAQKAVISAVGPKQPW
ncbi:MAG: insulinase family protein [Bdellovibrionales bacterium]|nr:insulinase family protein [Bdellovibrionales bacterium]